MSDPAAIVAARLAELWRKSLPTMQDRMAALRSSSDQLRQDPHDQQARAAGREAAHKLSGVLAIFGLPRGTELAAEIEALLRDQPVLAPEDLTRLSAQVRELDSVIASKS